MVNFSNNCMMTIAREAATNENAFETYNPATRRAAGDAYSKESRVWVN